MASKSRSLPKKKPEPVRTPLKVVLRRSLAGFGIAYAFLAVLLLFLIDPPAAKLLEPGSYTSADTLAMEGLSDLLPSDVVYQPGKHVMDHAGVFHRPTLVALEQSLARMHERGPMRVAVVTVPGTAGIAAIQYLDRLRYEWDMVYPGDEPQRQHAVLLISPRQGIGCFAGQREMECLDPRVIEEVGPQEGDSSWQTKALFVLRWGLAKYGADSTLGYIPFPPEAADAPRPSPLPRLGAVMDPITWRSGCLLLLAGVFVLQVGCGLIAHATRSELILGLPFAAGAAMFFFSVPLAICVLFVVLVGVSVQNPNAEGKT